MSTENTAGSINITVPDIGDAEDVQVIEILVSAGDQVVVDDSLITLESDKASMEIPATVAGVIDTISVAIGDSVNTGDVIGSMTSHGANTTAASGTAAAGAATAAAATTGATPAVEPTADNQAGSAATVEIAVVVPDIGDAEAVEVIEILVSVGDSVTIEQSLVTLESDKASMEIPSPADGVVRSISISLGDAVNQGSALLVLDGTAADASTAGVAPVTAAAGVAATDGKAAAGAAPTTAGSPPAQPEIKAAGSAALSSAAPTGTAPSTATRSQTVSSPTAHIDDEKMRKAHASPGVRRYAREHGADLSLITGSGNKSRIVKDDVITFIKQTMESAGSNYGANAGGSPGSGAGIPPIPEVDFSRFGEIERVELGRINKLSATNLHRAWLNVPMVTHHEEVDIGEMEAFRKQLKNEAREGDAKVTGLAFHMKALAATLKVFPKVNSSLAPDGQSLIYKHYCHIGIAVDTPAGLVVPVFRDVDKKSIMTLAAEMGDISTRARAKKLKPNEMQGASMTISSLGGIGGSAFTPIVNPPEVAILGITRARMQPVWNGAEFVPKLMCPLDMTYDHRVVDGAEAARFMAHYCKTITDIRRLLL